MFTIKVKHIDGSIFRHTVDSVERKNNIVSYYKDYKYIVSIDVVEIDQFAFDVA